MVRGVAWRPGEVELWKLWRDMARCWPAPLLEGGGRGEQLLAHAGTPLASFTSAWLICLHLCRKEEGRALRVADGGQHWLSLHSHTRLYSNDMPVGASPPWCGQRALCRDTREKALVGSVTDRGEAGCALPTNMYNAGMLHIGKAYIKTLRRSA